MAKSSFLFLLVSLRQRMYLVTDLAVRVRMCPAAFRNKYASTCIIGLLVFLTSLSYLFRAYFWGFPGTYQSGTYFYWACGRSDLTEKRLSVDTLLTATNNAWGRSPVGSHDQSSWRIIISVEVLQVQHLIHCIYIKIREKHRWMDGRTDRRTDGRSKRILGIWELRYGNWELRIGHWAFGIGN